MGYSSQAGHVILATQTAPDTFEPNIDQVGVGLKLRSGSLGTNRELLITDPEIGGGRDVVDAYAGAVSWGGDYEFYARMNSLPTLLRAALGAASSGAVTGVTTHTITPTDSAQLPFLSIEERIGSGLECYRYTDVVVNTLHLEADANGYLMGTVGLVGRKQIAGATPSDPVPFDDSFMIVGTNISITYNSVTLPAKNFTLDINNNFEDDDFRLGSFYIGDLTPKRREVMASFGIRESSSALWRQAAYGVAAATAPGGIVTKNQLVITAQTYENIAGGTPDTKASCLVTIPKFALTPYTLEMSGDDIIESDIEGQALRPSSGTPIMTVVVKNGTEDIF